MNPYLIPVENAAARTLPWFLVLLIVLTPVAPAFGQNEALQRLIQKYEAGLASGGSSGTGAYGKNYLKALNDYNTKLKQIGEDLDSIIFIRSEVKRFQEEGTLDESHLAAENDMVKKIQSHYIKLIGGARKDGYKAYLLRTEDYLDKLNQLEVHLVKQDKIDEAVEVRAESDRVKAGDRYQGALAAMRPKPSDAGESGSDLSSGEGETTGSAPESVVTFDLPENVGELVKTIRTSPLFYPALHRAPRVGGKREVLHFTNHKSRALVKKMQANIQLQVIEKVVKRYSSSSGYTYYYDTFHQIPRTEVRVGPAPLKGCTLIYDYYLKTTGSNRKNVRTERIPIGDLKPQQVLAVDPAGYSAVKKAWYKSGSYKESKRLEGTYVGYIVSVFDANNDLCYQRTSANSLAEFARTSLKDEGGGAGG
ncbi:MAG: hypothetical protein AAF492_20295 [Verrucomicrobiota bacterium]